jgi:hypothetical protein
MHTRNISIFQIDTCIYDTYAYIHIHAYIYVYVCSHTSLMPHVAREAVRCMCAHARSIIGLGRDQRIREKSLVCLFYMPDFV